MNKLKIFIELICSVFIFFSLFEIGSRIYELREGKDPTDRFAMESKMHVTSPFLVSRLKNNISEQAYDTAFNTNSYGFRGKEFDRIKPKGVFRIIAIGDSCTFGYGASNDENTYPALLEKKLNSVLKNKNIEVINAGVPGYKSLQSLIWFVAELMELSPDMLIVDLGWNDTASIFSPEYNIRYGYESIFIGKARFSEMPAARKGFFDILARESAAFRQMLKWSYKLKKHFHRQVVNDENVRRDEAEQRYGFKMYTENSYYLDRLLNIYRRSMAAISLLARSEGVTVILVKPPFLVTEDSSGDFMARAAQVYGRDAFIKNKEDAYDKFRLVLNKEMYKIIEQVSQRTGAPVFDATALFPHNEEICFEYFHDNAHLTDKGNDFFAGELTDFIREHSLI